MEILPLTPFMVPPTVRRIDGAGLLLALVLAFALV
jgi:hypothetical protein